MIDLLSFKAKQLVFILCIVISTKSVYAQAWMQGYKFRKIITIDKSKVSGTTNLLNFNVLIELGSEESIHLLSCNRPMQNNVGWPIAFALKNSPTVPLRFQIDNYNAVTEKLYCWVQIAELVAASRPGTNEIYVYYGGINIHEPLSDESRSIWLDYQQVWHMNFDGIPARSLSAKHSWDNDAIGNATMNQANFKPGLIGATAAFNGTTDAMNAALDTSRKVCVSTWIKLAKLGVEQHVLTNDSAGSGYRLKINAQGKVVFELLLSGIVGSHTSVEQLPVDTWTYIVVVFDGRLKRIYINGIYSGGGLSAAPKIGAGGSVRVGNSKHQTDYFNGEIDELRIAKVDRGAEWFSTEYRNQLNPKAFAISAAQETNPLQTADANEFTGAGGTDSWNNVQNWSLGRLPDTYTNVIVKANQHLQVNTGQSFSVNRLTLEPGAKLLLDGDLEVNCTARIDLLSLIQLNEKGKIIFKSDVVNNGTIADLKNGRMVFASSEALQNFSGSGVASVSCLEINQHFPGSQLLLNAKINVADQLELVQGVLNANGMLTLLASSADKYAVVMPFDKLVSGIAGNVNVQQFIEGNFSSPSTARGWWLLSSPVYQSNINSLQYNFNAIKESIFVTGAGGTTNGFDPSPNNNPTIYTHSQDLPGTLSQKYKGIPNMNTTLALGKGFYVFSRGSRTVPNAFEQQILRSPFSNPQPYHFSHSGALFFDELKVNLRNSQTATAGDGFNLIGNPYASPITWGDLIKVNVLPFLWVFDPKNNAYVVTDDPSYVIHSGRGFFVKVNAANSSAEVTFRFPVMENALNRKLMTKSKMVVGIRKGHLSDTYSLILHADGNDDVTDADAVKIGEGFISISAISGTDVKLAIDERQAEFGSKTIQLYVKGWETGTYTLSFKGTLNNSQQVMLLDHYMDKQIVIKQTEQLYPFYMDQANKDTYGGKRFELLVEPLKKVQEEVVKSVVVYPNPTSDVLYVRSIRESWRNLKLMICSINGSVLWTGQLPLLEPAIPVQIPFVQFSKGLYLLQLVDTKSNKTIATLKVLKN